jgi:hypothetical protein
MTGKPHLQPLLFCTSWRQRHLLTSFPARSRNDKNILYHAAPVSGRCYNLDDATAAFFWNTGGMLNPRGT